MKTFLIFTFCIFFLSIPVSASAVNINDGDEWTVDLDGSIKQYGMGLHTSLPWLVTVAPQNMSGMNWDSRSALLSVSDARLKFSGAYKEDRFKWDIQVHSAVFLSSQPNIFSSFGGGMTTSVSLPRFLPLQYTEEDNNKQIWLSEFDRIMLKIRLGKVDVIVGRQPIGMGVGFIWQPADLLGTFSPTEIDKEYKPGVDAVRINIAAGEFTEISFIGVAAGPVCKHIEVPSSATPYAPSIWQTTEGEPCSPGEFRFDKKYSSVIGRIRTTLGNWDLGIMGGAIRNDAIGGFFASGVKSRLKFRTEAVFTHHLNDDTSESFRQNYVRAIAGIDYNFDTKKPFHTFFELYYNGYGTINHDNYMKIMSSKRTAEFGEVQNPGMYYAGTGFVWEAADKLKINGVSMLNITDPSVHLSLTSEYSLSDESSLVLGGFLPLGKTSAVQYSGAIPTGLDIRSEFGLYPKMLFVQYKRYF